MNCLSRLSHAFRAAAFLVAALVAIVTVDTTGALAHRQAGTAHRPLVAQAAAPASRAATQVRS